MDITSLYYFEELTKDMHMTHTAERLYISQQTLSNHILRLEQECGVQLFYRKPKLALTYAGEYVLEFAKKVIREQQNLNDILADIKQDERGVLKFGASNLRINAWLPNILPNFSSLYPNIEIRITDATSPVLEPLIVNGSLDIAIIINGSDNPNLIAEPLMTDQIYLCVSDHLLKKYYVNESEIIKNKSKNGANLADFAKLPFCILSNRLGQQIEQCFNSERIIPNVYTKTTSVHIGTSIGLTGMAACFATMTSLLNEKDAIPDDLNIFPLYLNGERFVQNLIIIHHKDRYLSSYAKYFIKTLSDYCHRTELISEKYLKAK